MGSEFEKLARPYEKLCSKCEKTGFIPNEHRHCLDCIAEELNFQSWETVCLQCGKKTEQPKEGNKFCWNCIRANVEKNKELFLASISNEQKVLFEQYEDWSNAWASVVILD